jgi:hypothetical protein
MKTMEEQRWPRAVSWLSIVLMIGMVIAGLATAGQAHANLVTNGNFTSTTVTGAGGYLCVNTGSTCTSQLSGWTATCSSGGCSGSLSPSSVLVPVVNGVSNNGTAFNSAYAHPGLYWGPASIASPAGGNVVAIDGDPNYTSVLTQSISGLVSGNTYTLQFYQASSEEQSFSGATTEQWQVSLGGGTAQKSTLMSTPSQSYTGWTLQTMNFVANAASEVLQFVALGTPAGEPPVVLLSGVSIVQAPEPAGVALFVVGVAGVVVARRRAGRAKR